jgi:hypothetical protein
MESKNFNKYNNRYSYVFIDESGNSSNKMWNKMLEERQKNGFSSREFSTYTISGFIISSKKKYEFLKREIWSLKKNILGQKNNIHIHRTDLRNAKFLLDNDISCEKAFEFQAKISNLAVKHKLEVFSSNFNRELMLNKPGFELSFYVNKYDILEVCVTRLIFNIYRYYKDKFNLFKKRKKIILVFEKTNKKIENKILRIFSALIIKSPELKKVFKEALFMDKNDSGGKPIVANELIDFINYPLFLWASNTIFHQTKRCFNNFPNYEKKSISLNDKLQRNKH